eukprot:Ihof_evm2s330 gene=Ihof_evmTU2s330
MSTMSYTIQTLLEKMNNPDKDYRFMAANDLNIELQRGSFKITADAEGQVVKAVLALLADKNGEVQNLAVKCLPSLIGKVREEQIDIIIRQLCQNMMIGQEQLRDVSIIGLKTTIHGLPVANETSTSIITLLTTRLIDAINSDVNENVQMEALDIMGELLGRYGNNMAANHKSIQVAMTTKLMHARPAMRKRAIGALAKLVPFETDMLFEDLIEKVQEKLTTSTAVRDMQTYIQCITAINRHVGHRCGRFLKGIFPLLLAKADVTDDELRENCLQAIESFVLRCPDEVGQFIQPSIDLGLKYLVYDPNYDDDFDELSEEGSAMDTDNEEESDSDDADYSDDEDMSWKVRRASAKLLGAIGSTRPELLSSIYRLVVPRLINRFREREENVKVEVFNSFVAILRITKIVVYTKDSDDAMDTDDSPAQLLVALIPHLVKTIRAQLKEKSDRTRQGCFLVLKELVLVQPGCLGEHIGQLLPGIKGSLEQGKAKPHLKIDCLSFLLQLLANHSPSLIQPHAASLVGPVCDSINDGFYKIQAQALSVCTALVGHLRPITGEDLGIPGFDASPYIDPLYTTVMKRFEATDIDQEVKEEAIGCMSCIIANMGNTLGPNLVATLPHYLIKMRNEITCTTAVRGLTLIAESPLTVDLSSILADSIVELASYLRKNNRVLRLASLQCISTLITNYRKDLSYELILMITNGLHSLISDEDLQITQSALVLDTLIITRYPTSDPSLEVESPLLKKTLKLLESPLLQGGVLTAVTDLFAALINLHSNPKDFKSLVQAVTQSVRSTQFVDEKSGSMAVCKQAFISIAKTLAVITIQCPNEVSGMINDCVTSIESPTSSDSIRLLSLLCIGEIGSHADLADNEKIKIVLDTSLGSCSEDVKSGAARALGHVCVGHLDTYLPFILEGIKTKPHRQYLLLHSLKEAICCQATTETGINQLRAYVSEIWTLLLEGCETKDEGTRNVVAECLGKLVLVNPELLLPQLQQRLCNKEAHVRSTVVTAVKFTITDTPQPIDRLLKPLMPSFLQPIQDENLGVRRVALVTFNSAAHNKPSLIADLLEKLLPVLYGETVERSEYKREVQMGPFKHVIDDGLDIRKAAFECMYTLLDWCIFLVPLDPFISHVCGGMHDHYDIKLLTHLMVIRLCSLAPASVLQRMDEIIKPLRDTLVKKENNQVIKQEIEKNDELKRSVLRAIVALRKVKDVEMNHAYRECIGMIQ